MQERLPCASCVRLLHPSLEGACAHRAISGGCYAMAPWAEVARNKGVSRQEALGLAHRLEPLHLPLSPPGRPVRVLCSVVQVAALAMLDVQQQCALGHAIALQLVCDEHARRIMQTFEETLEEALCRRAIAAALHRDVEDHAVLIHGTPEIAQLALDADENLIKVPLVTGPRAAAAKIVGEGRAELQAPSTDGRSALRLNRRRR